MPRKSSFRTKEEIELLAIEQLREHLLAERKVKFEVVQRNVPTGNGKNYDYLLKGPKGEMLAVEQFLLLEGEREYAARRMIDEARVESIASLKAAGVRGFHVHSLGLNKLEPSEIKKLIRQAIAEFIATAPMAGVAVERQVGVLTFTPLPASLKEHLLWDHHPDLRIDGVREARASLEKNLRKKNEQLAVAGIERAVLISNGHLLIETEDVQAALQTLNLEAYPNIDTIYFGYAIGDMTRLK